jgi:hypothetical protein
LIAGCERPGGGEIEKYVQYVPKKGAEGERGPNELYFSLFSPQSKVKIKGMPHEE